MTLDKNDFKEFKKIVDASINKAVDTTVKKIVEDSANQLRTEFKSEIRKEVSGLRKDMHEGNETLRAEFHNEIGISRLEINQRFDETNKKIDTKHDIVIEKIEQIKQMETEDIGAMYKDIANIKKKLPV